MAVARACFSKLKVEVEIWVLIVPRFWVDLQVRDRGYGSEACFTFDITRLFLLGFWQVGTLFQQPIPVQFMPWPAANVAMPSYCPI